MAEEKLVGGRKEMKKTGQEGELKKYRYAII